MMEQIHGGDIYRNRGVLDFSVNGNPLGTPEPVKEAVQRSAEQVDCYPDVQCSELREAISRFEGVSSGEILCGNGAAELFFAVVLAVKPRRALLISPTFSEYEKALSAIGSEVLYYGLSGETQFDLDDGILDLITDKLDMLFLCNPNNPTGRTVPGDLLERIAGKCSKCGVFLVLDECFIDFLEEPALCEMKERRNVFPGLLVVKAFTKLFAMPGLRLGYGISSNVELLEKMRKVLQPWNVSVPAQAGGVAALTDGNAYRVEGYIRRTRTYVAAERRRMEEELIRLGFRTFDSKANYLFFQGRPDLYRKALEAGILIRDCSNYRGLAEGYYRVAVRTQDENERLLAWLRKL